MKTKAILEQDILDITMKINKTFPDLTRYINEIPVKMSKKDNEGITIKNLEEYYSTLVQMFEKHNKKYSLKNKEVEITNPDLLTYPPSDDIYKKGHQEMEIDPNDLSKHKTPNEEDGLFNEKDFYNDMYGDDLDVPGSELDDQQESVGSEDEENNYYSLGGDTHNDLDENND